MEFSSPGVRLHSDESAPPSPTASATASPSNNTRPRRAANVYDAVAGRVTLNIALGDSGTAAGRSKRRLSVNAGRYSSRNPKLAPEEALFRRKHAPVRYAEQDIYWANEDLPDGGQRHLPQESLLKAVHGYASRFYEAAAARLGPRCVVGGRIIDERSMDETALLAFGILLEEASREALGKTGHLVFTEAASEPNTLAKATIATRRPGLVPEQAHGDEELADQHNVREAKRRRVAKEEAPGKQTFS